MRAAWTPLRVAAARARARPGRGGLVVVGVAVAAAALGAVIGGSTITADRSLRAALEQLPVAQRSFTVTWQGAPPAGGYARIDRIATAALHTLGPGPPARTLAYPELNLDGQLALVGAVDDPGRWLRLRSGRLPRTCVPARCEVLQAKGTPVELAGGAGPAAGRCRPHGGPAAGLARRAHPVDALRHRRSRRRYWSRAASRSWRRSPRSRLSTTATAGQPRSPPARCTTGRSRACSSGSQTHRTASTGLERRSASPGPPRPCSR